MAYPNKRPLTDKYYTAYHADVTAATASGFVAIAGQGELISVRCVIYGAISSADETLNVYKNGVDTGYDIVITQSGSAAGDVDSVDIPAGAVTVQDGDVLHIVSANASSGTVVGNITYVVREA